MPMKNAAEDTRECTRIRYLNYFCFNCTFTLLFHLIFQLFERVVDLGILMFLFLISRLYLHIQIMVLSTI